MLRTGCGGSDEEDDGGGSTGGDDGDRRTGGDDGEWSKSSSSKIIKGASPASSSL